MKNTFRFTKKLLFDLQPNAKNTTYHDVLSRGLKLIVRPSGVKTFVLYRKINGRPERLTLGRFPDLSVEQARAKADACNSDIAMGMNPADARRSIRDELTFTLLFDEYLERYAKVHKRSWQKDEKHFQLYCQSIARKKLSMIRKIDLQKLHSRIGHENGHYTANRTLAMLLTVFNRAIEWGWCQSNPAKGIKKFKEHSRDRFLQADELPRLFKSLAQEPNDAIRDYVLMSLFTGARKSNVLAMRWSDINFDQATWCIPMTKNGEKHTVPLVEPALEILKIRQARIKSQWVFPGNGVKGHLVDPKKTWQRILDRAEIKDLRLHDLRRSLGSWQAVTGASLPIIGKTLAHKHVNTTTIYARLNLDPVRESMHKATQAMLEAVNVNQTDLSDTL